jgi:S-layer homology domain
LSTPVSTRRAGRALLAALLVGSLIVSISPAIAAARDGGRASVAARAHGTTVVGRLERRAGRAVQAPAPGQIGVMSSNAFLYDDGTIAVVGDLLNLMTTRRADVIVRVDFYNGASNIGNLIGYPFLWQIGYGSTTPFLVYDDAPVGTTLATTYVATVSDIGTTVTSPPGGALLITPGATTVEGEFRHFTGTVKNLGPNEVSGVFAAVTTYNAGGQVIDTVWDIANPDPIASGGTAQYDLFLVYDAGTPVARSAVTADGFETEAFVYYTAWSNYFDDIGNTSFRPDIIWNAEQGITTGCGLGKFCPNANVPRDQMASFMARGLGLTGSAPNAFTDDNGNPHEPNINLVAQAGIASGCGVGLYCPAALVARDQMASFLSRALALSGPAPNAFTDDNGNTHEVNINLVARDGIASGCGAGLYCPSAKVTRAQMAAFLHRAFD